jgi:hypothetical protein
LNEKEVIEAHDELKKNIVKALWDFSDKYSKDLTKDDIYQVHCIMQAVLCESSSELEYQIARCAPFTTRQVDHICYQIGDWYLMMKPLLEGQQNLGFMKEKLKNMICGDGYE